MGGTARRWWSALGVAGLLATGVACDPSDLPQPPELVVTTTVDAPDVDPGDGVCEATPEAGDCTLRAAVEEANALGNARVSLPAGNYELGGGLVITGHVELNGDATQPLTIGQSITGGPPLRVAAGGYLGVTGVEIWRSMEVEGALAAYDSAFIGVSVSALSIASPGTVYLQNTTAVTYLSGSGLPSIRNEGGLLARYSTVGGRIQEPLPLVAEVGVSTAPGATTRLEATYLNAATACVGAPVESLGYNAATDATCGLTAAGDLESTGGVTGYAAGDQTPVVGQPGAEIIDAVPVGVVGCGTAVSSDRLGRPRPVDGDADGVAGCDIGAFELQAAVAS